MLGSKAVLSERRGAAPLGRPAPGRRSALAVDLVEIAARLDRLAGAEVVEPRSPVEVLATRSDLVGSVAVAEVLTNDQWPAAEPRVDDGRWLGQHVAMRLESSSRWLEKTLADPSRGRSPLPGPARVHELLQLERSRAGRPADWLAQLADELGRPWTHRCLAIMRTLRREADRLRADSAGDLRALGPQSARLERLDAALRRSVAGAQGDTDQALARRFGAAFAAIFTRFVETHAEAETIERGLVDRFLLSGPAASLRADLDAAMRAVLREERALLESLVRACIDHREELEASAPAEAAAEAEAEVAPEAEVEAPEVADAEAAASGADEVTDAAEVAPAGVEDPASETEVSADAAEASTSDEPDPASAARTHP